jgi:hypothetical protein
VVLLGVLTNAIGWLTASNEVVYSNCFSHLRASLKYRNCLGGLEQALLLHERPVPPAALGLSPRSRLEFWTEFLPETPAPSLTHRVLRKERESVMRPMMVEPELTDSTLTFGQMTLGPGRVFALGGSVQETHSHGVGSAPVGKRFEVIDKRKFLIESVAYQSLEGLLSQGGPQEFMARRPGASHDWSSASSGAWAAVQQPNASGSKPNKLTGSFVG